MKTLLRLLMCLAVGMSNGFAEDKLVARVSDWAPLYFQENGEWKGSSIDFYNALTTEAGVKVEFVALPWTRCMSWMKTGGCDILAELTPTDERREFMHFIGPHRNEEMGLAIQKQYVNEPIHNLSDLVALAKKTGKRIAVQQDFFYSDEVTQLLKDPESSKYFHIRADAGDMVQMVANNHLLGFFEQTLMISYGIKTQQKEYAGIAMHPFILSSSEVYFGVSKTVSPAVLQKLQAANERLLQRGAYKEIAKKWSEL